jgi:hypothetical protein
VVGAEFLREWVLHDVVRLGPLSGVVGEVAAELAGVAARCDGLLVALLVRHAVASAGRGTGGLDAVAAVFAALGYHLWGPRPPPRPHGCTARPDGRARPSRRQLGQTGYARAARAFVPRARQASTPALLTHGEREVAGLTARGMSDRDIAARLQVSVRTVRDVSAPGSPGADLVVVQAGFVLRGLVALLDRPPGPGDAHQLAQRCGNRAAQW